MSGAPQRYSLLFLPLLACSQPLAGSEDVRSTFTEPLPAQPAAANTIIVQDFDGLASVEGAAVKQAIASFQKQRPDLEIALGDSGVTANVGVSAPDTLMVVPCLTEIDGPIMASVADAGKLRPLDDFVSDELRNDFLPSILLQGTYDGRLYSLAQFDSGLAIYGNRRYLRAAHVRIPTVARPWNLAEFEDAMARLAALPEVKWSLDLMLSYAMSEWYTYGFLPMLQGSGGGLISAGMHGRARGTLDSAESIRALERLQSWIAKGWVNATPASDDDFYASKTVALSWAGHWMYPSYSAALGDDLVLLPMPDLGNGPKTGLGSMTWAINAGCRNPAGTWAFLEYLLSEDEILRTTRANGAVPARRSVLARSKLYGPNGPLRLFVDQIEQGIARPRPITPHYDLVTKVFSRTIREIARGALPGPTLMQAAIEIDRELVAREQKEYE